MDNNDYINRALQEKAKSQYTLNATDSSFGILTTATINGRSATFTTQPTLADHIEQRMCRMQSDMDRLKRIKKQLSEPNGVLFVSVDDLRFAMNY